MDQGLLVGEESLGQGEPARLLDEIVEHAPAAIAVPCRHRVADHLADTCAVEEGQGHGVRSVDVSHQAVADRQVDLGVLGSDRVALPLGVEAEKLTALAAELAVADGCSD